MPAHMMLVSDRPVHEYEAFLVDLMHFMDRHKIAGVAVVALLAEKTEDGGDSIVGYHKMDLRDKMTAASLIQADITYKIAQDAARDLLELPEPDQEDED